MPVASGAAARHACDRHASGKKRAGNAGPAGCSVHSRRGIPARFYAQACGAAELCCGTVGQGGDANACAVLDEAACALARLAATVAGQLDADGLPVALTGGVARMGELFTGRFRRALEHLVPQCVYQPAKYSPVVGAALCVLSESAAWISRHPASRKICERKDG